MKRIFTLLVIFVGCVSLMQAQVVIKQETHGFNAGLKPSSQQIKYQAPGDAGQNVVWDFSKVEIPQEKIISSAEMEEEYTKANIKVMRDDNVVFSYNITPSGNEYCGYEAGNNKLIYTKPILKTVYPQSYGTFFEGNFEGIRSYGATTSTEVKGYYSTHADAEGTIILPDGKSYPALRVYTIERTDSETGSAYEIDKYLWYLQEARFPVFVSTQVFSVMQDGTRILRERSSYYNSPSLRSDTEVTAIENVDASFACSISPNPFANTVRISYSLPSETNVSIDLYNKQGVKLVSLVSNELQSGNVSFTKNISQYTLAQDTYLLKIQFGDKVYTQKLVKAAK